MTYGPVRPPVWQDRALCAEVDPELFFLERGGSPRAARRVCARCPVARECIDFALSVEEPSARHGVWGGTTPREREVIHRQARMGEAA